MQFVKGPDYPTEAEITFPVDLEKSIKLVGQYQKRVQFGTKKVRISLFRRYHIRFGAQT